MKTQSIARIGISAALLAVSAWITLPAGPVPFTLQTLVLALLVTALKRSDAVAAVALYLLLGTIGLPVFSGFGAGIGVIVGPTGGFLWGFLLGTAAGTSVRDALRTTCRLSARAAIGGALMLLISYGCGVIQLMIIGSLDVIGAATIAVFPFIIPDVIKLGVGISIGCRTAKALHTA